jgi:hypothetical protein
LQAIRAIRVGIDQRERSRADIFPNFFHRRFHPLGAPPRSVGGEARAARDCLLRAPSANAEVAKPLMESWFYAFRKKSRDCIRALQRKARTAPRRRRRAHNS